MIRLNDLEANMLEDFLLEVDRGTVSPHHNSIGTDKGM
jgi:hypothetical protein